MIAALARGGALLAITGLLAACSAVGETPASASDVDRAVAPDAEAPRAEQVAFLLARACEAARDGDPGELAAVLERLDAHGARPSNGEAESLVERWRRMAGPGTPPRRGRLSGPAFSSGWIEGGKTVVTEQTFLAGQSASIALSVSQGPPVRIRVSERGAKPLCESRTRQASCRWTPIFTRRYRIEVENQSKERSHYHLVID